MNIPPTFTEALEPSVSIEDVPLHSPDFANSTKSQLASRRYRGPPLPYKLISFTQTSEGSWMTTEFCQPRDPFEGLKSLHLMKRLHDSMISRIFGALAFLNHGEDSETINPKGYMWVLKSIQVSEIGEGYWIHEPQFTVVLELVERQAAFDRTCNTDSKSPSSVEAKSPDCQEDLSQLGDNEQQMSQEILGGAKIDERCNGKPSTKQEFQMYEDESHDSQDENTDATEEATKNMAKLKLRFNVDHVGSEEDVAIT